MRIAYLANPESGNGFYRGIGPMTALARCHGHQVRKLPADASRWSRADIGDVDVLHVHRYSELRAQQLAQQAKRCGAAVVWDNDDDMGALPKSVVTHKRFGGFAWERRRGELRRLFAVVDLVTAPSGRLAERFLELGAPRVEVIENFVPDQFLKHERRPHDGVTIGWVAGLEHQMDVERLPIRDALARLLDERRDVRVVTFGLKLGLAGERYETRKHVPLLELAQEAAAFDVGIAPLADLDFNRSRSNVKLKEYAAAGVPWLASPIGPYAGMGERQGGRLVADDRWYEELVRLVDKARERRKLAKQAAKWVKGEILSANAYRWEARFMELVERTRSEGAAPVGGARS